MTSISSGMDPQNGDATEHSFAGLLKFTGASDDGEVPENP
jgi:hypothetical protein